MRNQVNSRSIKEILDRSKAALACSGVPEYAADAEVLLSHILGIGRFEMLLHRDRLVPSAEENLMEDLVKQRAGRKPLGYVLGEAEFWSFPFKINEAVLIPRPETEALAETAIYICRNQIGAGRNLRILDLCTGSGILAVVLAKELPDAQVYATDILKRALEVARENASRHDVLDRVIFSEGDLFEAVLDRRQYFDVIVSNPPYVPADDLQGLMPEVRDFEPRTALDGGAGGLEVIHRIIQSAGNYLKKGGWLLLEIGYSQAGQVIAALNRNGSFQSVEAVRDYSGIERIIKAQAS